MLRITITPRWQAADSRVADVQGADTTELLALLSAVHDHGALAQAARSLGVSYRHAWGKIKSAEALFGHALVAAGHGRGSTLTPLAQKLIWADRRIAARLGPLLESLASELENELDRTLPGPPRAVRIQASHGYAIAALIERLARADVPVDLRYRPSIDAVAAMARGECDLAGVHVPIGDHQAAAAGHYRRWLRDDVHRLVQLAVRAQGLFVAPGNPLRIRELNDLARPGLRFVNRSEGSGTRMLTDLLLARAGIATDRILGHDSAEFTHEAVAACIASGMADVGIGVKTAAQRFGLHFVPLLRERYFLAVPIAALDAPPMPQVLELLRSPAYRAAVSALAGYEAGDTGRIWRIDEAFD